MLEANNIIIGELTPKQQLEGSLDNTIVYVYPETTSIEIIPTETSQTFIPEEGTYYDEVNVEGYVVPTEEITITATGQQQTIYPSNNKYINKINVNPIDVPTETINITKNGSYDIVDYANANVNVDVETVKINVANTNIKLGYSTFEQFDNINDYFDFTNCVDFSSFFCYSRLNNAPLIDTSSATNTGSMFSNCSSLISVPQYDLSKVINSSSMFSYCYYLVDVPYYNMPNCNAISSMFSRCYRLSNESLDNILLTCISMEKVSSTNKKLSNLGFTNTYQPVATIQALPHYQNFLDAGWTIGY